MPQYQTDTLDSQQLVTATQPALNIPPASSTAQALRRISWGDICPLPPAMVTFADGAHYDFVGDMIYDEPAGPFLSTETAEVNPVRGRGRYLLHFVEGGKREGTVIGRRGRFAGSFIFEATISEATATYAVQQV